MPGKNKSNADLDEHNQPVNQRFNARRNKEKAAYGLKGLLIGLVADQKLDEQELLFLDLWLKSHWTLRHDGDVIDLLDLVGDILEDGKITNDELEELNELINDIINYRDSEESGEEAQINELLGLLSGIAADNIITDSEIAVLVNWLSEHKDITCSWPADAIIDRLNSIFEDEIITDQERDELLEFVQQITGTNFEEDGVTSGLATEFFEDPVDSLECENKCFCFTGAFVSGNRKVIEESVIKKGAKTKSNVTKEVDYLVIGTIASRDWRFSSHGRKIEQAAKLKKKGHNITIITERTLIRLTN